MGLWRLVRTMLSASHEKPIVCIIDGFDQYSDRDELLKYVTLLHKSTQTDETILKFILTSRKNSAVGSAIKSHPAALFELDLDAHSRGDRDLFLRDAVQNLL